MQNYNIKLCTNSAQFNVIFAYIRNTATGRCKSAEIYCGRTRAKSCCMEAQVLVLSLADHEMKNTEQCTQKNGQTRRFHHNDMGMLFVLGSRADSLDQNDHASARLRRYPAKCNATICRG